MKITEINSEELQINNSGIGTLIGGLLFAAVGIGLGGWGILSQVSTNRWISAGIGAVFLLGGIVIFLSAASRRVILRRAGTSEVITQKLITKKTDAISFTTDQIASVNFETHTEYDRRTDTDGDTHETQQRVSSVRVLLKDTTEIMLATSRNSGAADGLSINGLNLSGFSRAPLYDEATRIASFYGVPLNTNMRNQDPVASLAQVISTVKQGIGAAAVQPTVATQPQAAAPVVIPVPAPVAATSTVQPTMQSAGPSLSEEVSVPPVPPIVPVASPTPQPVRDDRSIQVPPRY